MGRIAVGPIGLLPPSAAQLGVFQPEPGQGQQLLEGEAAPEALVLETLAQKFLSLRNPTLFPGPMIVWGWTEETRKKAALVLELRDLIPGCNIIPMPDYRPIYPKIDPEAVINPCHPNLTIQHNKINVCALIGVHCHFANITLKMIRANTNCYTMAYCQYDGHEDALISIRDTNGPMLEKIIKAVKDALKAGVEPWAYTPEGKEELEEIRARKEKAKNPEKSDAQLFMSELEQGLDENAE